MNLGVDCPKAAVTAIDLHRIKYPEILRDHSVSHGAVQKWTAAEIPNWCRYQE